MSNMSTGEERGFDLAISYEKFRSKPYYATKAEENKGIATVGYGMCFYPDNTQVKITDPSLSEVEAKALFTQIWNARKKWALEKIGAAKTSDNQLGAMLCFLYWAGYGNFAKSQLLAYHIRGDYEQAAREFTSDVWTTQGGQKLGGLVERRKREQLLYSSKG